MRSPARSTLAVFTAVALVLCLTVAALWVRNLFAADAILWIERDVDARHAGDWRTTSRGVAVHSAGLLVGSVTETSGAGASADGAGATHDAGWHFTSEDPLGNVGWGRPQPMGFGWWTPATPAGPPGGALGVSGRVARVPFWFLMTVTAAAAVGGWRRLRRERVAEVRQRAGLCRACGYDLRASAGPCPECGTAPEARPAHT